MTEDEKQNELARVTAERDKTQIEFDKFVEQNGDIDLHYQKALEDLAASQARCAELERQYAEVNEIISTDFGGWQARLPREIEIETALNETSYNERDTADLAIGELLGMLDAARCHAFKERDQLRQQLAEANVVASSLDGLIHIQAETIVQREAEVERLRGALDGFRKAKSHIASDDYDMGHENREILEMADSNAGLALSLTPLTALAQHDAAKDAEIERMRRTLANLEMDVITGGFIISAPIWKNVRDALAATAEKETT